MSRLQELATKQDLSWVSSLNRDPENDKHVPNKNSREVKSGHYVKVLPTPLSNPYMVIFSSEMANELGLTHADCRTNEFLSLMSGDTHNAINGIGKYSWATPYALSIYGQEIYDNCPFKNDTGYGDGRAISLTEVVVNNKRWELQLKGAGRTPFCRGADGRAVLRSCIREFLASEAMHHLNVPTTRALSITASKTDKVQRQWYSSSSASQTTNPRGTTEGSKVIENSICAMICRTASSFIRVGHIELFGRRAKKSTFLNESASYDSNTSSYSSSSNSNDDMCTNELRMMVDHAIFREFPHLNKIANTQERYIGFLHEVGTNIALLTASWARVGFNQGNFNSDNCHIAGKTLDYGPFGFIEQYDPRWNMWVDGGSHFAFNNQHVAGNKNFCSLIDAILPLLDENHVSIASTLKQTQLQMAINELNLVWALKLGFTDYNERIAVLVKEVLDLMETYRVDFTIFWRQLAEIVASLENESNHFILEPNHNEQSNYTRLFKYLHNCFYKKLSTNDNYKWIQWISKWIPLLKEHCQACNQDYYSVASRMKKISPKFVPREWMLKNAYERANMGDNSVMYELYLLFNSPYDEHLGETTDKYYKKMNISDGRSCAGTTFMSCSS